MKTLFAPNRAFICLGITQVVYADDYLRIGMEAAYAPLTGPKKMMQMELLKLTVPINMPMGTMCPNRQKVAEELVKTSDRKNILERFNSALTSGKMIWKGWVQPLKEVAFSKSYYTSEPVMLVRKDGNWRKCY